MASVVSIVYQPEEKALDERQPDYYRVPLQSATLVEDHGIQGDQKAGHHPDRQLNLLGKEWLAAQGAKGYLSGPGQWGEQIIVDGVVLENLPPGTQLQLGEDAVIEIVKPRTGCTRLEAAQRKSIQGVGPIGAMARVITGGVVNVGDPVLVFDDER